MVLDQLTGNVSRLCVCVSYPPMSTAPSFLQFIVIFVKHLLEIIQ